ncbi:MAG: dTDP-4-dehydrorhamnose 3,5-epimerase [Caldilineaceae bacterium]
MNFVETALPGALIIELEEIVDERGFFARSFCVEEFNARGMNPHIAQCNISYNHRKGTLRGMHYQCAPYSEVKIVRCTKGAIYDVIVDLRRDTPSFGKWIAVELTAANRRSLYIPEGFAHGFQTLIDDTEVFYQMSQFYQPQAAKGFRWNDSYFGIAWPDHEKILSAKDRSFPDFR